MPNWNQVLEELQSENKKNPNKAPFDPVRKKYLKQLFEERNRNIISYYSAWLQKRNIGGTEINDNDKNAFMSAIHLLDRKKGLDLILHTPGGDIGATESLVDYLKEMFNSDIEVFVPQIAMSAGTMIACASKIIHMGKQSNLGPIDPQIGDGVSAISIVNEFEKAAQEIKTNPERIPLWQIIINKYNPGLILHCENAIKWSEEIVTEWLGDNMHPGSDNKDICKKIVIELSNPELTRNHSRHISLKKAKEIGLKIKPLEEEPKIQDIVLTIHHIYMHMLSATPMIKIVENHNITGQSLHAILPQKAT